ncbi:MAG: SHOCT domain-containing protein [Gemmatimonadota bacterium]
MQMTGGWLMGWMWIVWIVIFTALVFFIVKLAQSRGRSGGESAHSAEDTLKQRYARGEIPKEEYEEKLRDLRR